MDNTYNDELVIFCKNCGSLHITEEEGYDFCNKCGSVDFTETTDIHTWLRYEKANNRTED